MGMYAGLVCCGAAGGGTGWGDMYISGIVRAGTYVDRVCCGAAGVCTSCGGMYMGIGELPGDDTASSGGGKNGSMCDGMMQRRDMA